jgi:hypothetical protein
VHIGFWIVASLAHGMYRVVCTNCIDGKPQPHAMPPFETSRRSWVVRRRRQYSRPRWSVPWRQSAGFCQAGSLGICVYWWRSWACRMLTFRHDAWLGQGGSRELIQHAGAWDSLLNNTCSHREKLYSRARCEDACMEASVTCILNVLSSLRSRRRAGCVELAMSQVE